jgi:hypothetical protein
MCPPVGILSENGQGYEALTFAQSLAIDGRARVVESKSVAACSGAAVVPLEAARSLKEQRCRAGGN